MKNIFYILAAACVFSSCEDFLDTESHTKKNTSNYPKSLTDAEQVITGIYSTLSKAAANPQDTHFYMAELASDDRFGGGGENDKDMQGLDHLMNTKSSRFGTYWEARYQGIFRANMALETLDNCTGWESEAQKNQFKGEAHYMRGMFYFELAQMFGEVPLVLKTEPENLPKAPADELYAQIAYDLKSAIELMESKPAVIPSDGHATKWAAEALMGRVFLFYTGYYKKDALPLAGEGGGSVTKDQVIGWIDDCIANSGHSLVSDFRNIWTYTNSYTAKDYDYVKDNNLQWEGDGCKETVFAVKFSNLADWGTTIGYSNNYVLHFGLRTSNGGEETFPFGQGWGAGPVNPTLWNEWKKDEPNDIRREGSILNVETDVKSYMFGGDKQVEETGFWQKKYIPIRAYNEEGKLENCYTVLMHGFPDNDMQLCFNQDLILIRFADVLLMQSELKQDVAGINRVRQRAGLAPIASYSLEALKKERRYELAFEGLRWFDIMRWGDAPDLLAKQAGIPIKNRGVDAVMRDFGAGYKARYEATGGFWPIPDAQVALSEGVLEQNKGWGTPDAEYPGW